MYRFSAVTPTGGNGNHPWSTTFQSEHSPVSLSGSTVSGVGGVAGQVIFPVNRVITNANRASHPRNFCKVKCNTGYHMCHTNKPHAEVEDPRNFETSPGTSLAECCGTSECWKTGTCSGSGMKQTGSWKTDTPRCDRIKCGRPIEQRFTEGWKWKSSCLSGLIDYGDHCETEAHNGYWEWTMGVGDLAENGYWEWTMGVGDERRMDTGVDDQTTR